MCQRSTTCAGVTGRPRVTDQRAAVYRYLCGTDQHPTADEVFTTVRTQITDISLATVYKSLETLVGCGLAETDSAFVRYPPLPVAACPGYRRVQKKKDLNDSKDAKERL